MVNDISGEIIRSAITVHQELGPGLLEAVYQSCLVLELQEAGLHVESELPVAVSYRGRNIHPEGFRLDLLVENTVIVELKSVAKIQPVHIKQLLTYLRLADKPLGLMINFNETLLKNGVTRVANNL